MPTAKDMELAKLLLSKGLISKAEMQRHLDDLDEMRRSNKDIALEQLILKREVISLQELSHLLAPKKRVVHCNKCNTMYRAQEEDVGKKFKCKKCGTFVIVPVPGQTQVRTIKPVQKVQPKDEIDSKKTIVPPRKPVQQEMTMLLGLDEEAAETDMAPISISPEDAPAAEEPVAVPKETRRSPPGTEMTIMLDLDEEAADADMAPISIFPEDAPAAEEPVAAPKGTGKVPPATEMTIMLDLDDDEEAQMVVDDEESARPVSKYTDRPRDAPATGDELEKWASAGYHGQDVDAVEIKPSLPEREKPVETEVPDELEEWALNGYGADGADKVEVEPKLPEREKPVEAEVPDELEEWALNGYGADGADKIEVKTQIKDAPDSLSAAEKTTLSQWADSKPKAKAENAEKKQISLVTPVKRDDKKSQKASPPKDEMTIMLGLDEESEDDEGEL